MLGVFQNIRGKEATFFRTSGPQCWAQDWAESVNLKMGAELKGSLPTPISLLFSNFFQLLQRSPVRLGRREPDIPRREIVFPAVSCVSYPLID